MNIFASVLIVLILLASIALILVVVVQKSKGGGLASTFASANNIMGVRKSTDMLEKLTWWFFGTIAVLCVLVSIFLFQGQGSTANKLQQTIEERAGEATTPTPALPAFGDEAPTEAAPATPVAPEEAPEAPAN